MTPLDRIIHKRFSGEYEESASKLFNLDEVKLLMLDAMKQVLEEASENINKQSITSVINKYQ